MATEDFPSLCCQVQQGALLDAEQMDSLKHHLEQLTFTKQMPDDASSQDLLLTHLTLLQNVLRYGFHEEQYADICQAVPQVVPHTLVSDYLALKKTDVINKVPCYIKWGWSFS